MKILFYTLLFSLCLSQAFAQNNDLVRIRVTNSTNSLPVPFVNIVIDSLGGYTADENGMVSISGIKLTKALPITVSCIGYEKLQTILKEDFQVIEIKPVAYNLKEVVIMEDKNAWRSRKLGNLVNKPKSGYRYRTGSQVALKIDNPQTSHSVTKILFYITKAQTPQAKFRAIVYEVDTATGLPGKILIPENMILQAEKGKEWVSYDISKYNFSIPPQGCYIAMEWVPESAQYEYHISKTSFGPQIISHGQVIGATISKDKKDWNKYALYWNEASGWFRPYGNFSINVPGIQCEILEKTQTSKK